MDVEKRSPLPATAKLRVPVSKRRRLLALLIALASDVLSAFANFIPPLEIAVDGVTALLLFAVLGFRWIFLPVLVMEAIPVLAVFPTWTVVVGSLALVDRAGE